MDTGAYLGKKGWIQGHVLGEIPDLEFENRKNVIKCIFRTLEQAGISIYVQWDTKTQILR